MLKRIISAIAIAVACNHQVQAQEISPQDKERLEIMEDSMVTTVDSMYEAFMPDSHPIYCERLVKQLIRTLKVPNSYLYPFDKLKQKINIIAPEDNAFRIFNWGLDISPIYRRYYGAIQLPQEQLKLYGLNDYAEKLGRNAEDTVLTGGKWYGALYYNILPTEYEGRKMYTMFGFSAGGGLSNKKVLDPLFLTDTSITFGAPVFGFPSQNRPKERVKRFILEYKKEVHVAMNWDKEKQLIIFDNLTSQVNDPNRKYTYAPSGEYDGFSWENDMWNFHRNLFPVKELQDGQAPTEEDENATGKGKKKGKK